MAAASLSGARRAWCLYDWGNSAFAVVCMTAVLPPYVASLANRELGAPLGTAAWGWIAALGLLVGVLLGPPLGAFADSRGKRRLLLALFAGGGALATAALVLALPGSWRLGAVLYIAGATGFTTANVFYDSLLPGLGTAGELDRISARGYAYGYVGGGLVLAVIAAGVAGAGERAILAGFVLTGLWWALFTIPVVRRVPEPAPAGELGAFARLARTWREARSYPALWRFLLAYWVYNDGIGTVIKMAGAYGAEIGIPLNHMLGALLLTQMVAAPATVAFGRIGERLGAKAGIEIALAGYVVTSIFGLFLTTTWQFWVLASMVGLVQGGAQALSRSLYARLLPAGREAEFFSFFDVSGRVAGIVGPVLFALVTTAFGAGRAGVGAVLALFVLGAWLLHGVDVSENRPRNVIDT